MNSQHFVADLSTVSPVWQHLAARKAVKPRRCARPLQHVMVFTLEVHGAPGGTMQAEYLQRHQVISWMQEVLEGLVKEQPDSPWSYVAQKAQQQEEEVPDGVRGVQQWV
eukprot:s1129_g11.t1